MEINGKPIEFDFSKSDLGDWELVIRCAKFVNQEDFPAWIEFLDRILVGGKKAFPINALRDVNRAFFEQLNENANPKAPVG